MPTTTIYSGRSGGIRSVRTGEDINVWPYWSSQTGSQIITSSTTTAASTNITWNQWSVNYTATTSGIISANTISTINHAWPPSWLQQHEMQSATREQIVERERQYREQRIRQEAEFAIASRIREAANGRAERILRESLSPKQCEELQAKGYFDLETIRPSGERKLYRIMRGRSRNVQEIDAESGRVVKHLCAHPVALVPDADTMLVQKFMLESAEEDFLRIANVS